MGVSDSADAKTQHDAMVGFLAQVKGISIAEAEHLMDPNTPENQRFLQATEERPNCVVCGEPMAKDIRGGAKRIRNARELVEAFSPASRGLDYTKNFCANKNCRKQADKEQLDKWYNKWCKDNGMLINEDAN
jgi:hypothetical protein